MKLETKILLGLAGLFFFAVYLISSGKLETMLNYVLALGVVKK